MKCVPGTRWFLFRRALPLALVFFALAIPAQAAPDFYGVKMKSEDFAQDVFLIENNKIADFSNNRPGTDKSVYAYGYTSSVVGGGHGFSVQVFNHSDKEIGTEKLFRELVIVTYDGRRYDRSETEMMWSRESLGPGKEATFNFKFPGIRIAIDEIRMVIFSFDLGNTSIYLFPLRVPEAPRIVKEKVRKPKKIASIKASQKKEAPKNLSNNEKSKKDEEKKIAAPFCPAPIKALQSFFQDVGERVSGKKEPELPVSPEEEKQPDVLVEEVPVVAAAEYPLVKPEQVIEGAHYHFRPDFRKRVQESHQLVEKKVFRDRSWSLDDPDRLFTREAAANPTSGFPRREANVVIVNPEYGFVVLDAGLESGFGKNSILDVLRNGRRIGKVMITKPRDKISGAVILPEWRTRDEIRSGDIVGMSR